MPVAKRIVFVQTALSTADPNMQALAWEMKTRVAIAEKDWAVAEESIQAALAVLEKREVPMSAWRVHATAWEFYGFRRRMNQPNDIAHRRRQESKDLRTPFPIRNRSVLYSLPPHQLAGFSVPPAPADDRQKALNGRSCRP